MGFAAGLKVGGGLVSQALENERLDEAAKRQGEEFERKKVGWKREDEQRAAEDTAFARYQSAGLGLDKDTVGKIKQTYGMTDAQIAAAGPALKEKLASYDGLDSSDLQNVSSVPSPAVQATGAPPAAAAAEAGAPALGLPPRFTAADVRQGTVDPIAQEQALRDVAVAKRDVAGIRASQEAEQKLQQRKFVNDAGKMKDDEALDYLHKNVTMQGGMPMAVAKNGKGGYTVISYDEKGAKETLLNGAQIKQLVAADMLSKNGFANEGLTLAGSVHKDFGELVGKYNTGISQQQTGNNAALKNANSDEQDRARTGIAAAQLGLARDKQRLENNQILSAGKDGITMFDSKSGKVQTNPWPEGTTDDQKGAVIKKFRGEATIPKVNSDGTVTVGDKLYAENPNFGKKGAPNANQKYIDVTPGESDFAKAFRADAGKEPAPAAAAAPAAGLPPRPVVPPVPLTQNERVTQEASERQRVYDAEQRRRAGEELIRRSRGLQVEPTLGD